jgi:transcription-repair coupling factor (superfamily II helicase)
MQIQESMNAQAIAEASKLLSKGSRVFLRGAQGLSFAYIAASLARDAKIILVASDAKRAEAISQDLRFLMPSFKDSILLFPSSDKNPYAPQAEDSWVVMERMALLHKIATGVHFNVLVVAATELIKKNIPAKYFNERAQLIAKGGVLHRDAFMSELKLLGFSHVPVVEDPGTFAVRGSIIDVFWNGAPAPVRIDLFGDEIERLNTFDPETQRTKDALESFCFGQVRELVLDDKSVQLAKSRLRDLADDLDYPTKELKEKLESIDNRIPFFGMESLLPAFYNHLESLPKLLEYALGKAPFWIFDDTPSIKAALSAHAEEYEQHYEHALTKQSLCFAPQAFLVPPQELATFIDNQPALHREHIVLENAPQSEGVVWRIQGKATDHIRRHILFESARRDDDEIIESSRQGAHHGPGFANDVVHLALKPLVDTIRSQKSSGHKVFLPVYSAGSAHRIQELLAAHKLNIQPLKVAPDLLEPSTLISQPSVHAYTFVAKPAPPSEGAIFDDLLLTVIAEDEIFGKRTRRKEATGRKERFRTTLADLEVGDIVVHIDHGVGVFKGLVRLNLRSVESDYLLIHYAGDDKLYLPVHRIHFLQKYSGVGAGAPRLDKLGGTGWQSKKKKVKEAVLAMAQDLLNLYAKRELAVRPKSPAPDESYLDFEARFAFETTEDQQKAIDQVLADMQKDRPMDRLICGDVGYGKTEVAMRAAMMCVLAKRQVAVLAPTTILAQQHGMTFTERFSETGVQTAVLSRFQSNKEVKESLKKIADGRVDIAIGTHRLLSGDVSFKELGLIIVDEEQRFGIKAKEQLKKLKTQVDVLTLSATPIPRTLQMAMFALRELSVIETPPVDRRSIRTSIIRFDDDVIRESILRELERGGQVYYVHNRVSSIQATADYLRKLVPEAKIEVGHGQMEENALEDVMMRFIKHEFNILVCTTIIETGIDVPSANTMFVDNADDFGLAQLYQLRGRIGRSKERAFAYLIIPGELEHLTPVAKKRLEILHQFSDLGVGFRIAQHDLEIRGAGDLLGKEQHGHVAAVGFDLYADLLKEAVEGIRGQEKDDVPDPDVNLPVKAYLPDNFITDLHERLSYYQRLAVAKDGSDIWDVIASIEDQYGALPPEVPALAEVMTIKQRLKAIHAKSIDCGPVGDGASAPRISINLGDKPKLNHAKLLDWIARTPAELALTPQMKLIYTPARSLWESLGKNVLLVCRDILSQVEREAGLGHIAHSA